MSRSIHWTHKIFKNKSKKEVEEMCDIDNPDYAVRELCQKMHIKKTVRETRRNQKMSSVRESSGRMIEDEQMILKKSPDTQGIKK